MPDTEAVSTPKNYFIIHGLNSQEWRIAKLRKSTHMIFIKLDTTKKKHHVTPQDCIYKLCRMYHTNLWDEKTKLTYIKNGVDEFVASAHLLLAPHTYFKDWAYPTKCRCTGSNRGPLQPSAPPSSPSLPPLPVSLGGIIIILFYSNKRISKFGYGILQSSWYCIVVEDKSLKTLKLAIDGVHVMSISFAQPC
jgi:hypothetical protein